MPKINYVDHKFNAVTLDLIAKANVIISEYSAQGYLLTVRQLYYQFVARDFVPNTIKSYKRIASIISDGRLAGLIDWNSIEDRTRGLESLGTWDSPDDIISSAAGGFRIDKWADQPYRVEVWVEKEALAGVFQRVCNTLRVPFLSCRGYTSQSEMWRASTRLLAYKRQKQTPIILHFGDHDPSGIDMSRDIQDRLATFRCPFKFERLALNMDQVREYDPPPNPAKDVDPRFAGYVREYGDESWELDALEPSVLASLVETEVINNWRDQDLWDQSTDEEDRMRSELEKCSKHWDEVSTFLEDF